MSRLASSIHMDTITTSDTGKAAPGRETIPPQQLATSSSLQRFQAGARSSETLTGRLRDPEPHLDADRLENPSAKSQLDRSENPSTRSQPVLIPVPEVDCRQGPATRSQSVFEPAKGPTTRSRTAQQLAQGSNLALQQRIPFHLGTIVVPQDHTSRNSSPIVSALSGEMAQNMRFGRLIPVLDRNDQRLQGDIVNLSNLNLSDALKEALNATVKCRQTPKYVPFMQLVAGAESAAKQLESSMGDQVVNFRIDCALAISRAKAKEPSLKPHQRKLLAQLARNKEIMVMSSDKGGKLVVLNVCQYGEMCLAHLSDRGLPDGFDHWKWTHCCRA